jgi:uncharacterized protein YidB (DUF937 family)
MFDRHRTWGLSRQRARHNLRGDRENGTEPTSERCRHRSNLRWSKKMSRGMPSMTALLGLLAIAGYQNRDKLAEMLRGAGAPNTTPGGSSQQPALGGLLGNLSGMLGGAGVGGLLNGGIGELLEKFKQSGQGETAQSWINDGPNQEISPPQLKQAIGPDVLQTLEQQTGLSQAEILARLSRELPTAVDKYTPEGRLPRA